MAFIRGALSIFILLYFSNSMAGGGKSVKANFELASSDSHLSPETYKLYKNLNSLKGKGIIFGHQDTLREGHERPNISDQSDIKNVSGKYPGLMGIDFREPFKWPHIYWEPYKTMIRKFYEQGGIITLSWHMDNPVSEGNSFEKTPAVRRLLAGGDKHTLYLQWLDKLANFLRELKGQHGENIPILLRPFHEFNGDWFWWSMTDRVCENLCFISFVQDYYKSEADKDFIKLYQFTINYLRKVKNIHSILVVYSAAINRQGLDYLWRYPGDDYVDIMGIEKYVPNLNMILPHLQRAVIEANKRGKVAALVETGQQGVPQDNYWTDSFLGVIKGDPIAKNLVYAMVWRNSGTDLNHFFAPYPGHSSVPNFLEMERDSFSLFLDDISVYK